jgi:uncharacterized protein (DUF58 family)
MSPSSRLLIAVGVIVVPLSILLGLFPDMGALLAAALFVFLIAVLLDALVSLNLLAQIVVDAPAVQRLTKNRQGQLQFNFNNPNQKLKTIRIGLPLPKEIHSDELDKIVQFPETSERSMFFWEATPTKRGRYDLTACYLEALSKIGFWLVRKAVTVTSEIRVYPNLHSERRHLAALFMNREGFGIHAQRQVGKGHEFEKLRRYEIGDSYDEIDWKATARRCFPVTRVFQVERTQEVYVVIDASRLSARLSSADGTTETTMLERFITSALVFCLAAERQGDLFGLVTFSNRALKFLPARNGKAHYNACRDALYTLEPQAVTPDFDEVFTFIRLRIRRRGLIVFLTSLDDPLIAESFLKNIDIIARQHLVVVNMLAPPLARPLFSDADVSTLGDVYQNLGGHIVWHNLRELEKSLKHRGVRFYLLNNERMSAQLVSNYLNIKQRQLL